MTRLSVNVNKVAVLRNSRGGSVPSVVAAAEVAIAAGCGGITVHPRPDLRHIRPDDVRALAPLVAGRVEYNIEGNPFAAARGDYPGMLALAREVRPDQVTLVPDSDAQLTSDHGFEPLRDAARLAPVVSAFRALGCRVSLFLDAGCRGVEVLAQIGADRIEIYTGPYAEAFAAGAPQAELERCVRTAEAARAAGLGVNAGHDLNRSNLAPLLAAVPDIDEVSIGHALFDDALYLGLERTVHAYLAVIAGIGRPTPG